MDYLSTSSSSAAGAEGVAITISKSAVAKKLGSTRQSLYYQPKLPARDLLLKSQVEVVMKNHPAYGYRRIAIALGVNRKRVSRVMRQFNLKPRRSPNYRPQPRRSLQQAAAAHSNLLTGLAITRPNQAWVSDFTYLPYQGRFVYLATILDSYTRELIGWNVSVRHNTELITTALLNALNQRSTPPQILHSDQGSEYGSSGFIKLLRAKQIESSMSAKSSPWQNGKQESFYQKFKLELGHPNVYPTLGELVEAIALQAHYYNHQRIHSALKMPPAIFYQRWLARKLPQENLQEYS